jgi:hypothetical protein
MRRTLSWTESSELKSGVEAAAAREGNPGGFEVEMLEPTALDLVRRSLFQISELGSWSV